jgi:small subunit ribosomal protein S6
MRLYELTLVVQPSLEPEALTALVEQLGSVVSGAGGQVVEVGQLTDGTGQLSNTDTWRRRRLAYPIGKTREGYYPVFRIQAPAQAMDELERQLKLNENVLRHLVVRTDEDAS